MSLGFFVVDRKIKDWEWVNNPVVYWFFFRLIEFTNYEDKKWEGMIIKRGSFVTSYKNLASELEISVQKVRTILDKLKSTGEVSTKSTNKFTIITICNFNRYQLKKGENNNQTTNEQQSNNNQTTNEQQQLNKYNKYNKGNKGEGLPNPNTHKFINGKPVSFWEQEEEFDLEWLGFKEIYPNKADLVSGYVAFKKLNPDKALLQKIKKAVETFKGTEDWSKDAGRWQPTIKKFIEEKRWEKILEPKQSKGDMRWSDFPTKPDYLNNKS